MKVQIKDIKHIRELNEDITVLTESIKKFGLLNRILIKKDNKLIDGLSRLKAMESLGHEEIECRVIELSPTEIMEFQITCSTTKVKSSKEDWIECIKKGCLINSDKFDEELVDRFYKNKKRSNFVTKEQYDWIILAGLSKIFGELKIK